MQAMPEPRHSLTSASTPCARAAAGAGGDTGEGCGCPPSVCALSGLRVGEVGVVQGSDLEADGAATLRAMGLRPSVTVRVCRIGHPCIVEVGNVAGATCRIGLARPLAERVMVTVAGR